MAKKPKKGGGAPSGGGGGNAAGKGGEGSRMKSAGSKAPSQEGAYQHETRKIILSAQKLRKVRRIGHHMIANCYLHVLAGSHHP